MRPVVPCANIFASSIAASDTPRTISPESGSPRSRTCVSHEPGDVVELARVGGRDARLDLGHAARERELLAERREIDLGLVIVARREIDALRRRPPSPGNRRCAIIDIFARSWRAKSRPARRAASSCRTWAARRQRRRHDQIRILEIVGLERRWRLHATADHHLVGEIVEARQILAQVLRGDPIDPVAGAIEELGERDRLGPVIVGRRARAIRRGRPADRSLVVRGRIGGGSLGAARSGATVTLRGR